MKYATRSADSAFFTAANSGTFPPTGGLMKRGFDIALASLALLFLSPVFLMLVALVKLTNKGPALYGHSRVGHNGRTFKCLKFRTMVVNGDQVLRKHLDTNPEAREEWQATRKLQDDPRVTPVGAVLRKLSLDELPQLLNIIRGEMSIVGPRPVVEDELMMYESAAVYYLKTRPGLTGLWQVSGRNDVTYAERVGLDTHYVKNWSLLSDVTIIAKTIPAVCLSRGSY